jgi:hypothetical protein
MTREIVARHDPAVLTSPHINAAMAVHRVVPMLTLVELLERAAHPGPVRRTLEHVHACSHCGVDQLCSAGRALASQITPPARTRGWRALRSADVARAQARKREGAA